MAGLSASQVAQINAAGARSRAGRRGSVSSSGRNKSNMQSLVKLATALANGNAAYNSDPLAGPQKKLADSIQAIMQSNAPGGFKNAAAGYSAGKTVKKDESAFDQVKGALGTGISGISQVLSVPQTLLTQPIRRLVDPKRNLLNDIAAGETTSSSLAGADWFKELPTPAKIAIGITADIATDPLTYVVGAGLISKLGNAPGIVEKIDKASDVLRSAGRVDDAERLVTFGGNLARKGKGGIGGIKNADLTWIGKTLEETGVVDLGGKALKGGLYFQLPGTGRIASYGAKKLTGVGIDSAKYQVYLGRGSAVEKISAGASNTMNSFKTSKLMSTLGDAKGGGEGQIKRMILNADSPQEALNYRRTLVSDRINKGTEAVVAKMMERKNSVIESFVGKSGLDRTVIVGALDGNLDDIDQLNSAIDGGYNMVRALDDDLIRETTAHIKRVVQQFGGDVSEVQPLVQRAKDHLHGVLTEEARAGMQAAAKKSAAKKLKYADDGVEGFMLPAKYVPGADHLGTPIRDARETLTRAYIVGKDGRKYILLGEANKPALARALQDGTGASAEQAVLARVGETLQDNAMAARELGIDGPVTQVRFIDDNGKVVSGQVSTGDIKFEELAPIGLGAKTQVNAINRAKYGHDLFSTDYGQIVQKQIRDFSRAAGNEVQGLYLKKFGLAASKGEDQSVAAAIAAQRGIDVPADAAASPAFQAAVVANVDDPARIQVAAIAANGAADARTSLATEPADFSLLSLTPEEAQVHIDGVLDDVQAQADALAGRSARSRPNEVSNIQGSIDRTKTRLGIAQEQIASLNRLIDEAEQINAGMPKQVPAETVRPERPELALGASEKPIAAMGPDELADYERSLDIELGNAETRISELQSELEEARKFDGVAADTRVSRQDLNDLRGEVKTEAGQVASQMRAQVDAVGGRLESPWNSPGGEWDWWKQLSRSQQSVLRRFMGGGEAVSSGAARFGGADVGRLTDGMGVDVFAEQWRQIRNLSPDANISEIMDDWASHVLQMNDAEKVASGVAGYTSLVQDWMAPGVFGDPARRLTTELLFPSERIGDRAIAENLSQHLAEQFSDAGASARAVTDIEAELRQLEASSDDLVNRYQEAMAELGRRETPVSISDPLEISELKSIRESIMVTMQSDADSLRLLTERGIDEAAYKTWTKSAAAQQGLANAVLDGWVGISRSTQVPEQLHEVMALLTKATGPDQLPGLFRYFDKLTNLFKSWAIASPGFIMRNGIGGMFNNYLIGVDAGRYGEFLKADFAFTTAFNKTGDIEKALAAVPGRLNEQYRLLHASGVLAETDRISDAAFGLSRSLGQGDQTRDAFGWLGNNPVTRAVYNGNSRMERVLRGAAGMDAAAKTGSLDGIYESVFKAHFDYADLNRFEVNWMKRISPFYTWTRKNLPLQMEMLFKNPKAYNRYNIFKKNIESVTPEEDLVPSWMRDRLNIRLPFTNKDGQMYILPDLPFTSLNMFTNVDELAGQINPVIKTPIEMLMNRKMYFGKSVPFKEGYVQMPDVLTKTGIAQVMGAAGLAERDNNGNFMTRDKTLYAVEQFLPFFGRMRRLLPSEKKYDERAATTWINFLFGTGLRTNTMTDRSSEIYYRQRSVDQIAKDLNSLGYGGYTYWNKRVETSRKPGPNDKRPYLTLNQPKGGLGANSAYTNVRSSSKLSPEVLQAAARQLASRRSQN